MSGTVLITGASSGFGEAAARRYAKHGRKLILVGRRESKLDQLRQDLEPLTEVLVLPLDVRNRDQVSTAVAAIPEEFKDIDVLVNNAGLALGLGGSRCGQS